MILTAGKTNKYKAVERLATKFGISSDQANRLATTFAQSDITLKTRQIKTEQADDDGWFTIKQSDLINDLEQQASDLATNTSEWMVDGWMDNM